MTSTDLAVRLRQAGLPWHPAPGDRFFLPNRDMDEEVFVLSDMTVEIHEFPTARVIGFNGVTEWALDSIDVDEAVWLPAEEQLRDLLGAHFRSLRRDEDAFTVTLTRAGRQTVHRSAAAAHAYALALLEVLGDTIVLDNQARASGTGPNWA